VGRTTTSTLHQALRLRRHARSARLAQLDPLKEELAYLKLLQGIAVVTFVSLVGWLVSGSSTASNLSVLLAIVGVALLAAAVLALHREIGYRIDEMRKL
jgi:uncharacterized membrane protein